MPLFPTEQVGTTPQRILAKYSVAANTSGGTGTFGAWTNRPLNLLPVDETTSASLASNILTIPIGIYEIDAICCFFSTGNTKMRLRDITNDATLIDAPTAIFYNVVFAGGVMSLIGRFTINAITQIALQYYLGDSGASNAANLGIPINDGSTETYTIIELRKL